MVDTKPISESLMEISKALGCEQGTPEVHDLLKDIKTLTLDTKNKLGDIENVLKEIKTAIEAQ